MNILRKALGVAGGHRRGGRRGWVVPGEQPPRRPGGSMVLMIATGRAEGLQRVAVRPGREAGQDTGKSYGACRAFGAGSNVVIRCALQCTSLAPLGRWNWRSQKDQGSRKEMGCLNRVGVGAQYGSHWEEPCLAGGGTGVWGGVCGRPGTGMENSGGRADLRERGPLLPTCQRLGSQV